METKATSNAETASSQEITLSSVKRQYEQEIIKKLLSYDNYNFSYNEHAAFWDKVYEMRRNYYEFCKDNGLYPDYRAVGDCEPITAT